MIECEWYQVRVPGSPAYRLSSVYLHDAKIPMTILLSLTSGSIRSLLDPKADPPRTLHDVPEFASSEFGLRGLSLDVDMLAGWSGADMDRLRVRSDQAACPCLVLVDHEVLDLCDEAMAGEGLQRIERLAWAASRLGCNAMAIRVRVAEGSEDARRETAARLQEALAGVERKELNLLLAPCEGDCAASEGLSELIKMVGGFRIGALPTYGDPVSSEDPIEHIRKLAPYAGAVLIRCEGFKRGGAHRGLDLAAGVQAAVAVGYQSNIVIDYQGEGDPTADIARAAEVLQAAIEAE